MDAADKKIFDAKIKEWIATHQKYDALIKVKVNYYTMTNQEKYVFDKMQMAYKKDVDYFNEAFDKAVKKQMAQADFDAMTAMQKRAWIQAQLEKRTAGAENKAINFTDDAVAKQ